MIAAAILQLQERKSSAFQSKSLCCWSKQLPSEESRLKRRTHPGRCCPCRRCLPPRLPPLPCRLWTAAAGTGCSSGSLWHRYRSASESLQEEVGCRFKPACDDALSCCGVDSLTAPQTAGRLAGKTSGLSTPGVFVQLFQENIAAA